MRPKAHERSLIHRSFKSGPLPPRGRLECVSKARFTQVFRTHAKRATRDARKLLGRTHRRAKRARKDDEKCMQISRSPAPAPREARNCDMLSSRNRSCEIYPSKYARCNSSVTKLGSISLSEASLIHQRLAPSVPLPLGGRLTLARNQKKASPPLESLFVDPLFYFAS
jgi:hypothetical protein